MEKFTYIIDGYTITEEVREITPQEAGAILATKNTKNRRVNKNHVKSLALDMINGTWRYNADPIRFDANGTLIDGQHRLYAIAISQVAELCKLVYGLNPECIKSIDVDMKPRNLSDLFTMDNIKDANNVAAIVNRYFALSNGFVALSAPKNQSAAVSTSHINTKSTTEQRYEFYYSQQEVFDEITAFARTLYKRLRIMQVSDIGGMFAYLFIDKHHSYDEVSSFFEQLYASSDMTCINSLRNKLINDLSSIKKMSSSHRQSIIAKTWNYYIKGKDVKVLSYNPATEGTVEFI